MRSLLPSIWGGDIVGLNDPFARLRRDMQDMFGSLERRFPQISGDGFRNAMPAIDIAETKDAIEVACELPGVTDKDISVTLDRDRLVISGEKKKETEQKDKNWHVSERSYGAFQRVIPLDFEPKSDAVEARFEKGILHVTVRKPAEMMAKAKEIPVKSMPN